MITLHNNNAHLVHVKVYDKTIGVSATDGVHIQPKSKVKLPSNFDIHPNERVHNPNVKRVDDAPVGVDYSTGKQTTEKGGK